MCIRDRFIHLTLVPYLKASDEIKTKPTQHSVKELRSIGIQPDILVCRCDREISKSDIRKISVFCNVDEDSVIQAIDVDTIYAVPKDLKINGLDVAVLNALGKSTFPKSNLRKWNKVVDRIRKPTGEVTIGVVGKYLDLNDAYKSLFEALTHGGISNNVKVKIKNTGKIITPRKLNQTHWGYICPSETPEGSNCGLVKNLALSAIISQNVPSEEIVEKLFDIGVSDLVSTSNDVKKDGTRVFVDGKLIGFHKNGQSLVEQMRDFRRSSKIHPHVGISIHNLKKKEQLKDYMLTVMLVVY